MLASNVLDHFHRRGRLLVVVSTAVRTALLSARNRHENDNFLSGTFSLRSGTRLPSLSTASTVAELFLRGSVAPSLLRWLLRWRRLSNSKESDSITGALKSSLVRS